MLLAAGIAHAQLATSAYRVLGQPDLRQNGVDMVVGVELYSPSGAAIDARGGQVHVYISDTHNCRVLAWQDARTYQIGDTPTLTLGQPGPQYSKPMGIGAKGFNAPMGMAVDPVSGNLFVADSANNRVLRFPSPFANPTRAEPDAVYGQPNFTTTTPGVSASLMNKPRSVAVDSAGNLWVADTGNHRILRFPATSLSNPAPPAADTVIGQKDFLSGTANRGLQVVTASGFDTPLGLAFDAQGNLYVADSNNDRVLRFAAPLGPGSPDPSATAVLGEPDFATRGVPLQASSTTMTGPSGVAVDSTGSVYVAVPNDNRVLIFGKNFSPLNVLGQSDFVTTTANVGVFPAASLNTLSGPADVKVDPSGNVYIADTGNNRLVSIPSGSKSATQVWGQSNFSGNGANQVKPGSLNSPSMMAIDYSQSPYPLYVSDTANHRVLVWKDSVKFRNGDAADMVIGQPDLLTAIPNVDSKGSQNPSSTSLNAPMGIAVQPGTGTLFVADSGNNRVLRFPRPVGQAGRITADAVIGQLDFVSSLSAVVSASSVRAPAGVAIGPDGDVFVADTGNNRVLEFPAAAGTHAVAIRVYGQPNFVSSASSVQASAQTLTAPQGVFVDNAFNLYTADTGANRVVIFPNTQAAPPSGTVGAFVIGQARFDTTSGGGGASGLHSPAAVSVDQTGNIYVSDAGNNRVLEFPSLVFLPVTGAAATAAVGQTNLTGTGPNWDSPDGLATAEGLSGPAGIYVDRQNTLYVADAGNSRVVHILNAANAVNAATYQASVPVGQGSLVALFGAGIATDSASSPAPPWPTTMLNRQVVVNDATPAPLYYVGPKQVNLQFPTGAPAGTDRIAVRLADTGELVAGGSVLVSSTSPGLFTMNQTGSGQAAATNQDNSINSSTNPAPIGSIISLYGTGQGQVNPAVPDGMAAPGGAQLASTVAVPTSNGTTCITTQPSMCVAIGTAFGDVQYSGLAPGFIGLWQINVKIPQGIATGSAVPVRVVINGTPSNTVTIAVR